MNTTSPESAGAPRRSCGPPRRYRRRATPSAVRTVRADSATSLPPAGELGGQVRKALAHPAGLAAHRVDIVAAQLLRQFEPFEQIQAPAFLQATSLAERSGLDQRDGETRVHQEPLDLFGGVLAVVPGFHLARGARPD